MESVQGSMNGDDNTSSAFVKYRQQKNISGEEALNNSVSAAADSGYGSYSNISRTPNISSNSSSSLTSNLVGSGSLITIQEGFEIGDPVKLTPVTQNIRKITDFHITTPELSSLGGKRNSVVALDFDSLQTTPKKPRLDEINEKSTTILQDLRRIDGTASPQCLRGASKRRKPTFRQKLKSAPDLDTYFSRNDIENVSSPIKGYISPIHSKSFRERRTPLANSNTNLLQYSTPKSCERDFTSSVQISDVRTSAVKKLLSFPDSLFNEIVKVDKSDNRTDKSKSPIKSSPVEYKHLYSLITGSTKRTPVKRRILDAKLPRQKTSLQQRPFNRSSRCKSILEEDVQEKSTAKATGFEDILNINTHHNEIMDISPLKPKFSAMNRTNWLQDTDLSHNSNTKSDVNTSLNLTIECAKPELTDREGSPSRDKQHHNKEHIVPCTPRRLRPSVGHQDKFEILYPSIPRTPLKKTKRLDSAKSSAKKIRRDDLDSDKKTKKCYGGTTRLNIIAKLESYSVVLDKILSMLSDQDLVQMTLVSKGWERIIKANLKASVRRIEFLKKISSTKENEIVGSYKNDFPAKAPIISLKKQLDSNRIPFTQRNIQIDLNRCLQAEKSPPVSPSKKKFHDNQKIARTLGTNDRLIKCPRCQKSSRVVTSFVEDDKNRSDASRSLFKARKLQSNFLSFDNTYLLNSAHEDSPMIGRKRVTKSRSVDYTIIPRSNSKFHQLDDDQTLSDYLGLSSVMYPYGECTGITCKYRFCLKCLCEYHPGSSCLTTQESSPSKEDVQNGALRIDSSYSSTNSQCTKNIRRKCLKRLCL